MYCEYWKLNKTPFDNVPDPSMYVASHVSMENVISETIFAIKEGNECFAVIIGDVGLGKTLSLRIIIDSLETDKYKIVLITNPSISFVQLLKEIIGQITGKQCEENGKSDLLETFNGLLFETSDRGQKIVIFIDEAHLVFNQASKALLDQLENIVKLIRSKGIGIFFVTQNPMDIPNGVLAQLGLKVQHALRAFTAIDRKAIKLTAENYPLSDYYKTDETITNLGIGEALVTALNEKGIPTPLAATMLRCPESRMDILSDAEIAAINSVSGLVNKYSQVVDRESAYEILNKKISPGNSTPGMTSGQEPDMQQSRPSSRTSFGSSRSAGSEVVKVLTSATFIRGVFGILKKVMK